MSRRIVCYPLKRGGSKWSNRELQHSLRSLDMHWKGETDAVCLLSSVKPAFLSDEIEFHKAPGYLDAMRKAIEIAGPGGDILWMNDDILFLKDTTWDDLVNPVRRIGHVSRDIAKRWTEVDNKWKVRLGKVMLDLHDRGLTTFSFSTHTPYWFEADKLQAMLDLYGHLGYKVAIESAYYNHYIEQFGAERIRDKFRAGTRQKRPIPDDCRELRFLNLTNDGLTQWMKGFVRGRFSYPCRFDRIMSDVPAPLPSKVIDECCEDADD